jgi:dinuclear metal center YbgI/SA1388 family protein
MCLMPDLSEMVTFMDRELRTAAIPDYPGAMNGLQLANGGMVSRILTAVDASLPVVEIAAADGPALLIVHHGMFWQGAQAITGPFYRKLKVAMDAGLAIYSNHLPLDVHPEWGNNILLAKAISLTKPEPFFEQKGLQIGLVGEMAITRNELFERLGAAVGGPVHICPAGSEVIKRVAVITGGAGSEVAKVASYGVDTFITGEGPHWSFPLAEELGINVFYAGHYATETFGVREIGRVLSQRFSVPHSFIDRPTGL